MVDTTVTIVNINEQCSAKKPSMTPDNPRPRLANEIQKIRCIPQRTSIVVFLLDLFFLT